MTARHTANTGPPSSNAVDTEAAMGTLVTVPTRNSRRTVRPLPDTTLADHVNCDHGNHISQNSSATRPAPAQSGWCTR